MEKLKELLNHKNIQTTMKYFKITLADVKEGYDEYNLLNKTVGAHKRGDTIKRDKRREE